MIEKESEVWETPTVFPLLKENEVHVWCADLNWMSAQLKQGCTFLSQDEKTRAGRFLNEERRLQFIAAHAVLNDILAAYLNLSSHNRVTFEYKTHGKPFIKENPDLFFNMSDSKWLALYVIAPRLRVGIDVEWVKQEMEIEQIALRFFSPPEYEALMMLLPQDRPLAFYRLWTLKEAYLKALGVGLSVALNWFSIALENDRASLHFLKTNAFTADINWALHLLPVGLPYVGGLAYEGQVRNLRFFNWKMFWNEREKKE